MKKRNIYIMVIILVILSILVISFFVIKNRNSVSEKLEINNNDYDTDVNNKNNDDTNINDNEGNLVSEKDNNSNKEMSEDEIINYFEDNYNNINNSVWDDVKNDAKELFITIVDFIFYDGKIGNYTFNDLSTSAKLKIISIALKIDNKIEGYIPDYKETISSSTSKVYKDVKEKLVTLYLDIAAEVCSNHEQGCDTAKEIFADIKDNCKIGWDFVKGLLSSGTKKLKDWYEVYSGK